MGQEPFLGWGSSVQTQLWGRWALRTLLWGKTAELETSSLFERHVLLEESVYSAVVTQNYLSLSLSAHLVHFHHIPLIFTVAHTEVTAIKRCSQRRAKQNHNHSPVSLHHWGYYCFNFAGAERLPMGDAQELRNKSRTLDFHTHLRVRLLLLQLEQKKNQASRSHFGKEEDFRGLLDHSALGVGSWGGFTEGKERFMISLEHHGWGTSPTAGSGCETTGSSSRVIAGKNLIQRCELCIYITAFPRAGN